MLKRSFDCVAAGGGLILLAPILSCLALLVKLTSPGPVLYGGIRTGKDGRTFVMYKFRTMRSDKSASPLRLTKKGDPRITTLGRFLRGTKLDELPQLFNILMGDMSVVGPRPEDPRYVAHYTAEQRRILRVRPGLVSAATLSYLHEEELLSQAGRDVEDYYVNIVMPAKLRLELAYLEHRSFRTDIEIVRRAIFAIPAAGMAKNKTGGQRLK